MARILEECRKLKGRNGLTASTLWMEKMPPPAPPPVPYPPLPKEQLNPPTPSVYVSINAIDLFTNVSQILWMFLPSEPGTETFH